MARKVAKARWSWLVLGLVGGVMFTLLWPGKPSLATATDRSENFLMATGYVADAAQDGAHEAVYLLDHQSGLLMAAILNRQTGKFTQMYQRTIANDFGVDAKSARYMMVTGQCTIRQMPTARTCLYVTELRSGQMIAYTFPWLGEQPGRGVGDFIALDLVRFRN